MEEEATHRAIMLAEGGRTARCTSCTCRPARRSRRWRRPATWAPTCSARPARSTSTSVSRSTLARPGFEGADYVCSTPLRARAEGHQHDLWRFLRTNDLSVVSTDHCPFCMKEQKELGVGDFSKIPNGIGGVEHRMDLIYQGVVDGELTLPRWVEICSTTPARMFGLYPAQGHHRPRGRCRHRRVRPERHDPHQRRDPPHEHGLLRVRGHRDRRQGRHGAVAGHGRGRRRRVPRHARATASTSSAGSRRTSSEGTITMRRVNHYIGGSSFAGDVRTHAGPSSTRPPASSRPRSTSLRSTRSTPPSPPPRRRSRRGARRRSRAGPRSCSTSASWSTSTAPTSPPSSPASTARCCPTPSARSAAASRTSSSPAASRTCSRAGSPSRRRRVSTCTPSASRSVWSPASRRSTSRRWSRCGCSPTPSPAATRSCSSRRRRIRRPPLFLAELLREAGLPDGVYNVVQGDKVAVDRLLEHPDVEAISFVGSTPIAKYIYETGTSHGKRVPGARRGQEPHDRAARCRHRHGGRRGGVGRLRLGRRALHGDLGRRGRRRRRRSAGRGHQPAADVRSRSAPATTRRARWAR